MPNLRSYVLPVLVGIATGLGVVVVQLSVLYLLGVRFR